MEFFLAAIGKQYAKFIFTHLPSYLYIVYAQTPKASHQKQALSPFIQFSNFLLEKRLSFLKKRKGGEERNNGISTFSEYSWL